MGQDSRTGDIYEGEDMKDLVSKFKHGIESSIQQLSKEEQEQEIKKRLIVFPFQVGDTVEVQGIKFKVEKIRQNPVNRVMLQGIPQDSKKGVGNGRSQG